MQPRVTVARAWPQREADSWPIHIRCAPQVDGALLEQVGGCRVQHTPLRAFSDDCAPDTAVTNVPLMMELNTANAAKERQEKQTRGRTTHYP